MTQSQRCEKHLDANDEVLVTGGDRPLADRHLHRVNLRDGPALLQNGQQHALPEGEEDDRLDHEELEHGAVRAEQLPRGEVKEEQGIQRQTDGDVVDDGDVQVTAGNIEVSIFVFSVGLQDNGDDGHERFDHTELESGLLTEAQEADGVGLPSQTAGTVHTAGLDGFPSDLCHDGALSSQVFIAQTQEVVNYKRFIAVPDGVKVDIVLVVGEEEEAEPRVEGVDRNDEEDPYDVTLLPR